MDTKTITLVRPIERGESKMTKLTLREPTSGDLRGLKLADVLQLDVNALMNLLPRICIEGLTGPEIAKLCPADLARAGGAVVGFFDQEAATEA